LRIYFVPTFVPFQLIGRWRDMACQDETRSRIFKKGGTGTAAVRCLRFILPSLLGPLFSISCHEVMLQLAAPNLKSMRGRMVLLEQHYERQLFASSLQYDKWNDSFVLVGALLMLTKSSCVLLG
jgi:hypothetical protein